MSLNTSKSESGSKKNEETLKWSFFANFVKHHQNEYLDNTVDVSSINHDTKPLFSIVENLNVSNNKHKLVPTISSTQSSSISSNPFLQQTMEQHFQKQDQINNLSRNSINSATKCKSDDLLSPFLKLVETMLNRITCHAKEEMIGIQEESTSHTTGDAVGVIDALTKTTTSTIASSLPVLTTGYYTANQDAGATPHPNGSRLATIQRAYDVFTQLDTDQDHCLSKNDLRRALAIFSPKRSFTEKEIDDIFHTADTTDFGRLHFSEFYAVFACLSLLENKFNNKAYNYITPQEVRSAMKEAGLSVSREQLDHMFTMVSEHSDSAASSSDFIPLSDILNIYLSAPRTESDLFLHSWNKLARSDFLHHKQHLDVSPAQDFFAGTCAGIALTVVGHPFDTIKVRMQTSTQFKSATQCVLQTIRKEGPFALYKGMSGPMATIPLINSLVFLAYGIGKSYFESLHDEPANGEPIRLTLAEITLAGAFSGAINSIIVSPVELIKTRLQIQYETKGSQAFTGPVDCIHRILKASGIKGLFRGMMATIYREIPGYAGQFFVYELLKRFFMDFNSPTGSPRQEFELSAFELLIAGGIAGMGGWVMSYPMDYVKSQIQAEPWNRPTRFKKNPIFFDGGFISAWKYTMKTKGFRQLWKGFGVCLLRAWPANAAGFLAYETALGYMRSNGIAGTSSGKEDKWDTQ